jgi:hypothetical protein
MSEQLASVFCFASFITVRSTVSSSSFWVLARSILVSFGSLMFMLVHIFSSINFDVKR